jgi:phenylalanyl-tRNA synthetase beta subunit
MSTLNGGFSITRDKSVSDDDKDLINEFMRVHGVTKIQPAEASGSEISRSTHDRISAARKEFRKARTAKNRKVQ